MDELSFNSTYEVEGPSDGDLIEEIAKVIHSELRGKPDYVKNHIMVNYGAGYLDVIVFWNSVEQAVPEWLRSQNNFNIFVSNIVDEIGETTEE